MKTRSDKIKLIKGLLTGERTLNEIQSPHIIVLHESEDKILTDKSGKIWSAENIEVFKKENPHLKVSLIIVKRVIIKPNRGRFD